MIIEVQQGKLAGTESRSVLSGKVYYSFLGIPYAKPPTGDLRFQPPIAAEKWEGVRSARTEGNSCFQKNVAALLSPDPKLPKYVGSEDCLYLNVFTPEPPCEMGKPKAVMIFIHGGSFEVKPGGPATLSPDFLIENDVIIVAFNYRLNILGFLNTGTPNCPGNLGMKDQVLAFRWIKDNISRFGGDPENITIFGHSAGATSVILHMVSPLSKELFNKAIALSPIIFLPESRKSNSVELGLKVGHILGYEGTDPYELVEYLKKQSLEDLLEASAAIQSSIQREAPGRCSSVLFPPSAEAIKENAFLPDVAANLLKSAQPKPFLTGMTNKEGTLVHWSTSRVFFNTDMTDSAVRAVFGRKTMKKLQEDFTHVIRSNFNCDPLEVGILADRVKQFYFGDRNLGPDTADEFIDLYTDLYFLNFEKTFDFILKSETPVYVYHFTFDGKFHSSKRSRAGSVKGAGHGDELSYILFSNGYFRQKTIDEPERTIIQNMCAFLTNFAKTGNPTTPKRTIAGAKWTPCKTDRPCYLQIDEESKLMPGHIFGDRRTFLRDLLSNLQKLRTPIGNTHR